MLRNVLGNSTSLWTGKNENQYPTFANFQNILVERSNKRTDIVRGLIQSTGLEIICRDN